MLTDWQDFKFLPVPSVVSAASIPHSPLFSFLSSLHLFISVISLILSISLISHLSHFCHLANFSLFLSPLPSLSFVISLISLHFCLISLFLSSRSSLSLISSLSSLSPTCFCLLSPTSLRSCLCLYDYRHPNKLMCYTHTCPLLNSLTARYCQSSGHPRILEAKNPH